MEAVIFGRNNKKRKRDEVDGLDNMDDHMNRRRKMIEERLKLLNNDNLAPEDLLLRAAQEQDLEDEAQASKMREQQARELQEEEELSEEEVQKQLEKDEAYKVKKAVQAMREKGELQRYNSLKAKEQKEDERIEQQVIDLNGVPKVIQQSRVQITRTVTSMIDKKKVVMDNVSIKQTTNIINHKNIEIETVHHKPTS